MEKEEPENEIIELLLRKLSSKTEPNNHKSQTILLRKAFHILCLKKEEKAKDGWLTNVCHSPLLSPPSFNIATYRHDNDREIFKQRLSEWAGIFNEMLLIGNGKTKGAEHSHLKSKWKEGVVQIIKNLITIGSDNVLTQLMIGFDVIQTVSNFVRQISQYERSLDTRSHDSMSCNMMSHDQLSWIPREPIKELVEKMTVDWLPRLQLNDSSHLTMTESLIKSVELITEWTVILFELKLFDERLRINGNLVLLVLQKYIQNLKQTLGESRDVYYWYKIVKLLSKVYESFKNLYNCHILSTAEKSLLLQINEWVWQFYNATTEKNIAYHTHLCQSSLLHSQANYQGRHVSFSIQMWSFYLSGLIEDVIRYLPAESSQLIRVSIITRVLENTLRILTHRYAKRSPLSSRDTKQYQGDVMAILLCVSSFLPYISDPMLLNEERTQTIHRLCTILFHSLIGYTAPLLVIHDILSDDTRHTDDTSTCHYVDNNNNDNNYWQISCLLLEHFGLDSFKDEWKCDLVSLCALPYINQSLLLKCILTKQLRNVMVSCHSSLFSSLCSILVYCEPCYLMELFVENNINLQDSTCSNDGENNLTQIAISWLRDHTSLNFIANALMLSAVQYTVASMNTDQKEASLIVTRFFEELNLLLKNVQRSVLSVLLYLATTPTKEETQVSDSGTRVLFGCLFEGVLQFGNDIIPSLSKTEFFPHWNSFSLIIQHFFPSSFTCKSLLSPEVLGQLDITCINSAISEIHHTLCLESRTCDQRFMDSRCLSVTAGTICIDEHGNESFNILDSWIKENKERIYEICLAEKECPFVYDVVKTCTHINNTRLFAELFDANIEWKNVFAIKDLSDQDYFKHCILARWEMKSEELSEEDYQMITKIKHLLAY